MPEKSPWADAIGPLYAESGLARRGISDTSDLIRITTVEGTDLYPMGQFEIKNDPNLESGERLIRHEKVLELWNTILRPAITEQIGNELTFAALMFNSRPPRLSRAGQIVANPANYEDISLKLKRLVSRWSH